MTMKPMYEFRKKNGVWQRRIVGERQWKTLKVEDIFRPVVACVRRDGTKEYEDRIVKSWTWAVPDEPWTPDLTKCYECDGTNYRWDPDMAERVPCPACKGTGLADPPGDQMMTAVPRELH
jgi:hypothetical protein